MFLYSAADGDGRPNYHAEALVSARSLRRHTDAPIRLLSDRPDIVERLSARPDFPFTTIEPIAHGEIPKAAKIRAIGTSGGQDCIFLDTDTVVLDDITKVFRFAPFDLAAVGMPYHLEAIDSIAAAVRWERFYRYHLNSGVLFVRGPFAERLSHEWGNAFAEFVERHGPGTTDQPPLGVALARLKPDLFALSQNYNFRSMYGGVVSGKVFVVHTHYRRDLERIVREDFSVELIDRFIEKIAAINETPQRALLPIVPSHTVPARRLRRAAYTRGSAAHTRLRRVLWR